MHYRASWTSQLVLQTCLFLQPSAFSSFSLHSASPSPKNLVIHLWFGDSNPPKNWCHLSQTDAPPLKVADIPASPTEPDAAAELMAAQTSGAPTKLWGWYWEIRCRGGLLMYFFMVCILCALLIFVMFTWNYIIDLSKWNILVLFGIIKNQGRTWCLSNCSWWCLLWGNSKAMLQLWRLPYRKLMQLVWMQRL